MKNYFPTKSFLFISLLSIIFQSSAFAGTVDRGPYLQKLSATNVIIKWRVNDSESANNTVHYGTSISSYSFTKTDNAPKIESLCGSCESLLEHRVELTNLSPGTRYYYEIGTTGSPLNESSARGSFMTPPSGGAPHPTRVWVIGDSGTGDINAANVRDRFKNYTGKRRADLVLALGDNAYTNGGYSEGSDGAYEGALFDMYPEILRNGAIWTTFSDGEPYSNTNNQTGPFFDIFEFPENGELGGIASEFEDFYSFDFGNIHFVVLNSLTRSRLPGSEMLTWLENDLSSTNQEWIITIFHNPAFSNAANNDSSIPIELRTHVLPILESHGVDLVLAGNNHWYERSYLVKSGSRLTSGNGMSLPEAGADGAYNKSGEDGTVYAVMGMSSRHISTNSSTKHPLMYKELDMGDRIVGSMVLDIYANRLEGLFLDDDGLIRDKFAISHGSDTVAPTLFSIRRINSTTLDIQFSEPVEEASAETNSNYSLDNGVSISSAERQSDPRVVRLTTSSSISESQTLTVVNVKDYAAGIAIPNPGIQFSIDENTPGSGGGSPPSPPNNTTVSFQNGINGYSGTQDAYLRESSPNSNFGNATFLLGDGSDADPNNGNFGEVTSVISWDTSSIPTNAVVESASIILDLFNISSGNYNLYEANAVWAENTVNWNTFEGSGAIGSTILGTIPPNVFNLNEIILNGNGIGLVQGWVDGSIANNGIIIKSGGTSDGIDLDSSEAPSGQPKLVITYSVPSTGDDTESPVVTAPSNITSEATGITTPVNIGTATATDNEGVTSLTHDAPAEFPVGTTTVTWTAQDAAGNIGTDTQTITIVDTTYPVVIAPEDLTTVTSEETTPVDIGTATATDEVGVTSLTHDAPAEFPIGTTTVTWTAQDAAGNSNSDTQIITVEESTGAPITKIFQDGSSPTSEYNGTRDSILRQSSPENNYGTGNFLTADLVQPDPDNGKYGEVISIVSWDISSIPSNAIIQSVSITFNLYNLSSGEFNLLEATGSWTETTTTWNSFGSNIGSTVLGTILAGILGENIIDLNSSGINLVQNWVNGSNSNNGIIIKEKNSNNDGIFFNSREAANGKPKLTIIYSLPGSGGDTESPIVNAPANINTEATGITTSVNIGTATATDNVGVTSLTHDAPAEFPIGTTIVTWTAQDAAGNTGTDSQTITIVDTTAPVVTAPADINTQATGETTPVDIGTATATDSVGVTSIIHDAPAEFPIGTTIVTWTAQDAAGNTGTDSQTIIVEAVPSGPFTMDFQDNVDPDTSYTGTRDAQLRETSPSQNEGLGTDLWADGRAKDPINGLNGELMSIIKWDISSIPSSADIQSVSIVLDLFNGSSSSHEIFQAKSSWAETTVNWNAFTDASNIGTDVIGVVPSTSSELRTITLNQLGIDLVKGWIDGSIPNDGLIIRSTGSSNGIGIRSRENFGRGPKISITYTLPY